MDFINKDDLDSINDDIESIDLDSGKLTAYIKKPENVEPDILLQISDLINGFSHFTDDVSDLQVGPSIVDKVSESFAVAYVLEGASVVACAIIQDPTKENYKGIIPQNYYELESGYSLEGMLQQEYFVIKTGYEGKGIAGTLRSELLKIAPSMFIVVHKVDTKTTTGLVSNGYTHIADFETDWEKQTMSLYILKGNQ